MARNGDSWKLLPLDRPGMTVGERTFSMLNHFLYKPRPVIEPLRGADVRYQPFGAERDVPWEKQYGPADHYYRESMVTGVNLNWFAPRWRKSKMPLFLILMATIAAALALFAHRDNGGFWFDEPVFSIGVLYWLFCSFCSRHIWFRTTLWLDGSKVSPFEDGDERTEEGFITK